VDQIRILVVDDHSLVRAGIRSLLEKLPGIQVVAEASDGSEALRRVAEANPQIVLMDLAMPNVTGLEATSRITKEYPDVRVIILSIYSDSEHVYQALRAGAAGYLLKGAAIEELELAIRSVARGETYLSPPVSKPVIAEYIRRTNAPQPKGTLSSRQQEILKLIAEGKTTKQIALELNISVKTVESHRAQLMDRLDIHDLAGLVRYAIRMGLIGNE
jgi:DNA-binding NarL/FixJ family response regulator